MELITLTAFLFLAIMLWLRKKATPHTSHRYQYQRKSYLLSKVERSFYSVLVQATEGRYIVMTKVRIADVLSPPKGIYDRSRWYKAFNIIAKKHFDFVLCHPNTLAIEKVLELNDKTHERSTAQKREKIVTNACRSAHLPLITIQARRTYSIADIRMKVSQDDQDIQHNPD